MEKTLNYYYTIDFFMPITNFLLFGLIMFLIGFLGIIFTRKNIISLLMCIEIMILGLSLLFITHSIIFMNPEGQIYSILLITIAAAESAIGLGILVLIYRKKNTISLDSIKSLKH